MIQEYLDQIVALPATLIPKNGLLASIVEVRVFLELVFFHRPAGKSAGRFLYVLFRVIADAEREQLHQLPAEVLVGMSLPVRLSVEPEQQGGVMDGALQ